MMPGTKVVRLEPLSDPPSTTRRGASEEAGPRQLAMSTSPARLTVLNPKAAVQRYMQVNSRPGFFAGLRWAHTRTLRVALHKP